MEATVEVSRSLFCIKFMKRDVCKCNQIRHLRWLPDPYKTFGFPNINRCICFIFRWQILENTCVTLVKKFTKLKLVCLAIYHKNIHHHHHHHHHNQKRPNITKNLKDRNLMKFLKNLSTLWRKMSATQKILGINLKL